MYYQCKRCFYYTTKKTDMKRHLDRKIKCHRIIISYKYFSELILSIKIFY